jgi:exopolysaccharide biosynthesis protein PssK
MTVELVARNAKRLRESFSPLISRGTKVAHVDFTETPNAGNHAMWLGEERLLADLGAPVIYQCSPQSYDKDRMAEKLGDGLIVLHGGAHAGGQNAANRSFRWRVLMDFPENQAIVMPHQPMPQDEDHIKRAAETINGRNNLILFASSEPAREMLRRHFRRTVRVELAPDPSFLLQARKRSADIAYELVWIARTDGDAANDQTEIAARLASQAAEKFSIAGFNDGLEIGYVAKHRPQTILLTDWAAFVYEHEHARSAVRALSCDAWAQAYVNRALYQLSLGQVVITDRLHAHILALLLDIPHVLLNDGAGRNWSFHEMWTKDSPRCLLSKSPQDAWVTARNAALRLKDMSPQDAAAWTWRDLPPNPA